MADLWNNIIYESTLIEKVLEYYKNKSNEKKENEMEMDLIKESDKSLNKK
jgi:hypothetical protein